MESPKLPLFQLQKVLFYTICFREMSRGGSTLSRKQFDPREESLQRSWVNYSRHPKLDRKYAESNSESNEGVLSHSKKHASD